MNEKVELQLGDAPDVELRQTIEARQIDASSIEMLPLVPGAMWLRQVRPRRVNRIEISNAKLQPVTVELRMTIDPSDAIVRADYPLSAEDDKPVFRVRLKPHQSMAIRYQTQPRSEQ